MSGPMRTSLTSSRRMRWRWRVGGPVRLREESLQVVGECEVGLPVRCLCLQCIDLAAQVGFSCPQGTHPVAEFVDGEQLFGEHREDAGDRGTALECACSSR